jgi:hypothetical protein
MWACCPVVCAGERTHLPRRRAATGSRCNSAQLLARFDTDDEKRKPKGWPANARSLTTLLKRQAPLMRRAGWTVTNEPAGHANVLTWTIAVPPDKPSAQGSQPSQNLTTDPSASVASVQYRPTPPDECALCGQLADDEAELCAKC